MIFRKSIVLRLCLCVASALLFPPTLDAQTTKISTEYLMPLYAPLEPGQEIDSSLYVYNVRSGGWVKGPRINGTLLAPSGDWFRVLPSGASRLDVRATIKTDDGALIYITYNGIFKDSEETEARASKGEVLTSKDVYFVIAPTMQTSAKQYDWLNGVQCIGKIASYKSDSYVKYDIFGAVTRRHDQCSIDGQSSVKRIDAGKRTFVRDRKGSIPGIGLPPAKN
jgi:Protein of unknown function (DUF3237)